MRPAHLRPDLRVGDAEREAASRELGRHFREGRLQEDELEARVALAQRARVRADLARALRGLPRSPDPTRRGRARAGLSRLLLAGHATAFVGGNVSLWSLWAIGGGEEPWPAIPLTSWLVVLGAHALSSRSTVARIQQSAELPRRARQTGRAR